MRQTKLSSGRHASIRRKACAVLIWLLGILTALVYRATDWFKQTFGVTFDRIIYNILAPKEGMDTSFIRNAAVYCLPAILAAILALVLLHLFEQRILSNLSIRLRIADRQGRSASLDLVPVWHAGFMVLMVLLFLSSLKYLDDSLWIRKYIASKMSETRLYETDYIDPDITPIRDPEKLRNLIYIYVESLETSYASVEDGGSQPANYMPGLTQLAKDNYSFSDGDKLGGFTTMPDTGWTTAGIFATSSGIPLSFPADRNSRLQFHVFAQGATTLGDILAAKGYQQEFLCGSDKSFGARQQFFEQHLGFEIFDYFTAKEKGYIAPDYKVWWGFEDKILYQIARDEILRLAADDRPFNFTMLTVDTHFPDGYVCDLCEDTYPEIAANVVACADRQLMDFLDWCSQQDFYDNTTIVITGDHPRMDTALVEGIPESDRTVYNCFVNSAVTTDHVHDRALTHMDIFPTVLAAMGFEIEGDRLGLGTNLFSDVPTLAERIGLETLYDELSKRSTYFTQKFSAAKPKYTSYE